MHNTIIADHARCCHHLAAVHAACEVLCYGANIKCAVRHGESHKQLLQSQYVAITYRYVGTNRMTSTGFDCNMRSMPMRPRDAQPNFGGVAAGSESCAGLGAGSGFASGAGRTAPPAATPDITQSSPSTRTENSMQNQVNSRVTGVEIDGTAQVHVGPRPQPYKAVVCSNT